MAVWLRTAAVTVLVMAAVVSVRSQLLPINGGQSMNMPPPMGMNRNGPMPMPMNMPLPETNLKAFRLPDPPKLEGALAPNSALSKAQKLYLPGLKGAESLVVVNSYIYTGVSASRVIELVPTPRNVYMKYRDWELSSNRLCYTTATVSKTRDEMGCGRPLGLRMHRKSLIGVDATKGIFQISFSRAFPNGTVTWLLYANNVQVNGQQVPPFRFLNDLAITKDDLIYFTTSSDKHTRSHFMKIILEGDDTGRVWRFNMRTRQVQPVLHTLHFPNGLQLAQDDSFLLVAEGARAKIHRVWLKGPRRGQKETFADNLPGFVDNIRVSPRGTYWVALSSIRTRDNPGVLDRYGPMPKIRQQILMMPEEDILARAPKYGMVVELNQQGQIIRSLHDPTGKVYGPVSEVHEYNGVLFLGSYKDNFIGVLTRLPPIVQPPPPPPPTTRPASNNNSNNNALSGTNNNNGNNMTINNNSNGSTGNSGVNNNNSKNKTSYNNNNNDNTNFANKNGQNQNQHYSSRKDKPPSSSISSSTSTVRSSSSILSLNKNYRSLLENQLSHQVERQTQNLTEPHLHGLVLKVLHRLLDAAISTRRMQQRADRLQTHLHTLKHVLPLATRTLPSLAATSTLPSGRAGGSQGGLQEWVAPGYVQPSSSAADVVSATTAPGTGGAGHGRFSQLVKLYLRPGQ